jgi:hypothetical protein
VTACPVPAEHIEWSWYAEKYGWTPAQVDALPMEYAMNLPAIAQGRDYAAQEEQQQAQRRAQGPRAK